MANVIGVITARVASKRLPGKVMKKISGKTIFAHHVERMNNVKGLSGIFLATSKDPLNKELIKEAGRLGCGWYAGAEEDVVERHIKLCERERADAVIRVPCDSPLFDIDSVSRFVEEFKEKYRDYIYVTNMTMLQGTVKELISYKALCKIHQNYRGPAVSINIIENMDKFNTLGMEIDQDLCRPEYRLTVDYPIDLMLMRKIYKALYNEKPLTLFDVYVWLDNNPQIAYINKNVRISGINKYIGKLMDKPIYSIVNYQGTCRILDIQGKITKPGEFMKRISNMFPEFKKINFKFRKSIRYENHKS